MLSFLFSANQDQKCLSLNATSICLQVDGYKINKREGGET
jgi:hypothetical protein